MISKRAICTISTASHLGKCYALADSIHPHDVSLQILLTDMEEKPKNHPSNVQFHFLHQLSHPIAKSLIKKYKHQSDKLRWSLKSVFLLALLSNHNSVLYVDNDILFFNDFNFLFEDLQTKSILLTPHHYPSDPSKKQNWFEANYRVGLFNAGFVGASREGKASLEWWAKACLYRCEKNYWRGLFDDQKYLDLLPIIDPKCSIVRHLGCNVAAWNKDYFKTSCKDMEFLVNEKTPLIFYHFNNYSLASFEKNDPILIAYLDALEPYLSEENLFSTVKKMSLVDRAKLKIWKILNKRNGSN